MKSSANVRGARVNLLAKQLRRYAGFLNNSTRLRGSAALQYYQIAETFAEKRSCSRACMRIRTLMKTPIVLGTSFFFLGFSQESDDNPTRRISIFPQNEIPLASTRRYSRVYLTRIPQSSPRTNEREKGGILRGDELSPEFASRFTHHRIGDNNLLPPSNTGRDERHRGSFSAGSPRTTIFAGIRDSNGTEGCRGRKADRRRDGERRSRAVSVVGVRSRLLITILVMPPFPSTSRQPFSR